MLIGEDQVARFQLVHFEESILLSHGFDAGLWSAFLFLKLTQGTFVRVHCSGSHLDSGSANDPSSSKPLTVLKPQVAPPSVPMKQLLLMQSDIVIGVAADTVEGLGGLHGV